MTATSSRSVAARSRCSSDHEAGSGRTVEKAPPAPSMTSWATTVIRKWAPVARPVMIPWSIHERSDSDLMKVVGTTADASRSPTWGPRPTISVLSMSLPM